MRTVRSFAAMALMFGLGEVVQAGSSSTPAMLTLPVHETSPALSLDPAIYHLPAVVYPRGLNLVFVADGYPSWETFMQDTELLLNSLKTVEPWKSYTRYNLYQIRPPENLCTITSQHERKPVLRCAPEQINPYLIRLGLHRYKLIVLSRQPFQSWANVSRLSNSGLFFSLPESPNTPADWQTTDWLFLHLIGHAFGLKDEEQFVIANAHSAAARPDGPNCAPDRATAEQWWGDLVGHDSPVGYFPRCAGNRLSIKPTQSSLMNLNDLSNFTPTYGPVSERYLRMMLNLCFSDQPTNLEPTEKDFLDRYPEFQRCISERT